MDLCQLNGLVYINGPSNQRIIHYCPEYELPEDVAERIQHLFKLKDKWAFDEIKPYIELVRCVQILSRNLTGKFVIF